MSLIEQAAKRLALLRQAGAEIPDIADKAGQGDGADARVEPFISPESDKQSAADGSRLPFPGARQAATGAASMDNQVRSRRVELDLDAIAAAGIVSPLAPRSPIAEQYRLIKRPLLANALGKGATPPISNGNLIMVTSAMPGEGKTFNAVNLAMSMATELDNTVMLVDADVARPSLLEVLGLPPGPGLLDMLQDESISLSSTLLRTNVEKLTILPSGTPHPKATELLASDAMGRLIHDMANRYTDRIIIFDSPPLLVTTESHVLATHMGQVVMVIEAERTLQSQVMQALATIESCPVKLVILNKAKVEYKSGYSYGYGYAYGYG